jgi:LytR cell envelope-related transcriptional attenuator
VESSYAAPTFDAARWRTAALVVSAVAAVELAVLVAIGVAAVGKSVAHRVQHAALAKAAGVQPVPKPGPAGKARLTRGETNVLVLNGGGVTGAAGTAADSIRARGYRITSVGNAAKQSSGARTLVMFRPGYRAEAARLARDVHTKIVAPLDGMRPTALMGAQVVLVVGH